MRVRWGTDLEELLELGLTLTVPQHWGSAAQVERVGTSWFSCWWESLMGDLFF